ncbi:MAG: 2-polyprenylphenol 6-hydroxylase [Rhodospirillaceae bacterium]|nr:2-polyprenylphenol 6-hydroxylase [Rhodospirillaceae bacterium]
MIRTFRNLGRLFRVFVTFTRHDALFVLDGLGVSPGALRLLKFAALRREAGPAPRQGENLRAALHALGPAFIKLGQALSCRPDIVGEEVAADLADLQDKLPPFAGAVAIKIIEAELGRPLAACFARFEDRPVAAASIAQVHFAETADGREVAVKVLRPGIEAAFARDLDLLTWLAERIEAMWPAIRRLKPIAVVDAFAETVAVEMDLRMEAAAAAELGRNFSGDPDYRVPEVDWTRTARRVLTIERISGLPIDERAALIAAGHEPREIVARAGRIFFKQVFRDGFFHADQHPGNMFVETSGRIVAVDFGIMGRIDQDTRFYLATMLAGFLDGDYRRVAEVHFRAGYVPAHKSIESFAQACRAIAEPILGRPTNEISLARLLAQLFQVTETFEMETQPQLLLLQKTMLVAEGVGRRLDPTVNMWLLARPLIEEWMNEAQGVETRLRVVASDVVGQIGGLPLFVRNVGKAAAQLANGGVRLDADSLRALGAGARPWPWGWIAAAAAIGALIASAI